jgi:hypothetical protein
VPVLIPAAVPSHRRQPLHRALPTTKQHTDRWAQTNLGPHVIVYSLIPVSLQSRDALLWLPVIQFQASAHQVGAVGPWTHVADPRKHGPTGGVRGWGESQPVRSVSPGPPRRTDEAFPRATRRREDAPRRSGRSLRGVGWGPLSPFHVPARYEGVTPSQ